MSEGSIQAAPRDWIGPGPSQLPLHSWLTEACSAWMGHSVGRSERARPGLGELGPRLSSLLAGQAARGYWGPKATSHPGERLPRSCQEHLGSWPGTPGLLAKKGQVQPRLPAAHESSGPKPSTFPPLTGWLRGAVEPGAVPSLARAIGGGSAHLGGGFRIGVRGSATGVLFGLGSDDPWLLG